MFNLKDKFEFLEDGVDFPFYNDVPKLSAAEWLMLLLSVINDCLYYHKRYAI